MAVAGDTVWPFYPDTSAGDPDIFTNEISLGCQLPPPVEDLRVSLSEDGASLTLTWNGAVNFFGYLVFEDVTPDGRFATLTGTSFSGAAGLTVPAPEGSRYYLVAAQNDCGVGPM
jgi:hypothetical protein